MLHKAYLEKKELILGMDHNLDLLKSNTHKNTQDFLDINIDNNLFPSITHLTRITKSSGTLIDNIFTSQSLHKSFDSCIVLHDISDHMPSIVNIHNTKHDIDEPLEFECRSLSKNRLHKINNLLLTTNWTNLHKDDINKAFNDFQKWMGSCIDTIAPIKRITIPNHKIWKEPWLSKGLTKSMDKCLHLYKKSITTDAKDEDVKKYKSYRNCLTKIKWKACTEYYIKQCYNLKSNMKRLWSLINNIIGKVNDKTSVINHITVENVCYYDAKEVANKFGKFYSTIGVKLAQNIDKTET